MRKLTRASRGRAARKRANLIRDMFASISLVCNVPPAKGSEPAAPAGERAIPGDRLPETLVESTEIRYFPYLIESAD